MWDLFLYVMCYAGMFTHDHRVLSGNLVQGTRNASGVPTFETDVPRNVTTAVGQTAFLHCRVHQLSDKEVSGSVIPAFRGLPVWDNSLITPANPRRTVPRWKLRSSRNSRNRLHNTRFVCRNLLTDLWGGLLYLIPKRATYMYSTT